MEAVYALFGALVGSLASLGGMYLQQHYQNKRDLVRIAADLAAQDYKVKFEHTSGPMPPVSSYVIYHHKILQAMTKGDLSTEKIEQIHEECKQMASVFDDASSISSKSAE